MNLDPVNCVVMLHRNSRKGKRVGSFSVCVSDLDESEATTTKGKASTAIIGYKVERTTSNRLPLVRVQL